MPQSVGRSSSEVEIANKSLIFSGSFFKGRLFRGSKDRWVLRDMRGAWGYRSFQSSGEAGKINGDGALIVCRAVYRRESK